MRLLAVLLVAASALLARADQVAAASGVLHRLLGRRADAFRLSLIPKRDNLDVYRLSAQSGIVQIEASSGSSLTRAAYTYLKDACHCLVTWDGDQLSLPKELPDFPATTVVCPNRFRHYYNVCTFGYSTAFWDWRKWEREIDWMALHGINMPLAMNGQERVWEMVWEQYALNDQQILRFFTGPAFLPWHRMGNVDGHGGPLPQDWVDGQERLQKRILARERELGMTPIVPGFSGFVPKGFADNYPRAKVLQASGWAGFEPTHQLDPRDPMFAGIQRRFIEAYTKTYGADHLYLCDLYNEMNPTVSPDHRDRDLAETGVAIYKSLLEADPQATWVMQGWLFHDDPTFWKEPEIAAFLSRVPDDRMILLDLACEEAEVSRQSAAFRKKLYIWNLLHGFGGRTKLFGDLPLVADKPIAALNDPRRGAMAGMGLTMEGIDENSAIYELMCDTMWRTTPADPAAWMIDYIACRYGTRPEIAKPIADAIREAFYSGGESVWTLMPYQLRPGEKVVPKPSANVAKYRSVVATMLAAPSVVQASPLFRRDLVDVAKRFVAEALCAPMSEAASAAKAHDQVRLDDAKRRFDTMLTDLDALLDTIPQYRLSAWIGDAKSQSGDSDLMELNARMQVTIWGGPELNDYAAKEWSGLVGDFYRPRWDRFFDALAKPDYDDAAFRSDSAKWELDWCSKTGLPRISRVDAVEQVRKLLAEAE